jgi:hypothetical protein
MVRGGDRRDRVVLAVLEKLNLGPRFRGDDGHVAPECFNRGPRF